MVVVQPLAVHGESVDQRAVTAVLACFEAPAAKSMRDRVYRPGAIELPERAQRAARKEAGPVSIRRPVPGETDEAGYDPTGGNPQPIPTINPANDRIAA